MSLHSDQPHTELATLCGIARDSDLAPEQFSRLESLLAESAEARRFYVQFFQLHAYFSRKAAGWSSRTPPIAVSAVRRRFLSGAAMAAASIVFLLAGWWFLGNSIEPIVAERELQPIASLSDADQAQWQNGFEPSDGERLIEGQALTLASGRAQISMSCGAELVLKAPCSIVLTSSNQVLLRDGLVSVHVADWTEGFTVATEAVHIVDLGKQFVVSADPKSGAVEAHAIDGRLRLHATNVPVGQQSSLLVSSGEAIRISPTSNTSTRLRANGTLFDQGQGDPRPFKPLELHNTGRGLVPGDEDPHWRIISSSDDDFNAPQYACVCSHYEGIYLANDPDVSQWISLNAPAYRTCPPFAMYTFETEFDLTGYDLSTITLVAHVLADNGVSSVRINDHSVAFKPWMEDSGDAFRIFRKIEIFDGFVEGLNRIQFDVWNGAYEGDHSGANPMAFRVEWQAFGRLSSGPVRVLSGETILRGDAQLDRLVLMDRNDMLHAARGRFE